MTPDHNAEAILKMIEQVDPSDTAKLDEIDLEVSLFLKPERDQNHIRKKIKWYIPSGKYTRSRDALKAIRPEGWEISIEEGQNCWDCSYYWAGEGVKLCRGVSLPTEELAELHAIIQAIAHERTQGEK